MEWMLLCICVTAQHFISQSELEESHRRLRAAPVQKRVPPPGGRAVLHFLRGCALHRGHGRQVRERRELPVTKTTLHMAHFLD